MPSSVEMARDSSSMDMAFIEVSAVVRAGGGECQDSCPRKRVVMPPDSDREIPSRPSDCCSFMLLARRARRAELFSESSDEELVKRSRDHLRDVEVSKPVSRLMTLDQKT